MLVAHSARIIEGRRDTSVRVCSKTVVAFVEHKLLRTAEIPRARRPEGSSAYRGIQQSNTWRAAAMQARTTRRKHRSWMWKTAL